ncbi:MAG: hypothetical protein HeimC2_00970 [Candidatus Heimdallarchaeota archaeon LC_2]|nr:MAG: hypothetical protein HeimC2_00970 [Candidatus Heimdallarchaeota archaeon LC_2]
MTGEHQNKDAKNPIWSYIVIAFFGLLFAKILLDVLLVGF